MAPSWLTLRRLALALPLILILHVIEGAPAFLGWFNARVEPDITARMFWSVNATAFVITLAVAWAGLLMLAYGVVHVVATIADGVYAPGVVTAILLYLPASLLLIHAVAREHGMPPTRVAAVALVAGIPMYVHGWRIVFEGSRLF